MVESIQFIFGVYFIFGFAYWLYDLIENASLVRSVAVATFWPIFFGRSFFKGLKEAWNE